jgi:hypothetical protein
VPLVRLSVHYLRPFCLPHLPPFGERVPYVAAVVELAEGPRMMTEVIDCPVEDLAVDMALEVTFRELTDEVTIAVFRPAAG